MTPRPQPLDPDYVEARRHRETAEGIARDLAPDMAPRVMRIEMVIIGLVIAAIALICCIPALCALAFLVP